MCYMNQAFIDGQNLNLAIPINDLEDISMDEDVTLEELFEEITPVTAFDSKPEEEQV